MGASSSINNNQQLTEDSEDTAVAVVSFHDNEIQDLIKSFFDFYTNASIATVHSESNTKQNHWNFDRFEIVPIDSVNNIDNIEQKLLTEYFRSISTLHPLRVHQHIFEYISSGILNIPDGDEYAKLMSIVSRIKDQIQSLIAAAEMINLVSGNCATISFTSAQEEFLQTAAKRLDSVCRRLDSVGSFAEHLELLRNNSLPIYVQKHIRNESNHFQQPSKIILAYYAIFRGRILPLVLNLKHEILEWAKNYDCEHTKETTISIPPSIPLPTPNAVMGVSLRFLKEFVLSNEIPADMTTAKVVSDIIVPKTRSTKETYINSFLLSTPNSVSDLRKNYRKDKGVLVESGSNYYNKIDGFYCFLSHAWSMPFLELISIAEHAANVYFKSQVKSATFHISDEEDILDSSFFWIDVFCKNQHIPAPAMEEFHKALKAPDVAVIALFPKQPIALQRIWCLFEIWTAVVNNITILPTMSEDSFRYFSATAKANFDSRPDLRVPTFFQDHVGLELRKTVTEQFKSAFLEEMKQMIIVRVEDSTATVPADIDMIMDLINQSTSVGQLNDDIYKAICETLWTRIENECGYSKAIYFCFDGDGAVSMWNGTFKRVRDVRIGDAVVTVEGKRAEIALITCDDVDMTIGVDACYCKGMWITAEHPILWHSPHNKSEERTNPVWVMPQDVLEVQRAHSVDALFNFELSPGSSSVVINGVGVLTLGQEIGFDPDADALFGWGWKDNPIRKKYLPRVPDQ